MAPRTVEAVGVSSVRRLAGAWAATAVACCCAAAPAAAIPGRYSTAALQNALRARGLYAGNIDGLRGPATTRGLLRFQRGAGLVADAIAGPRTRSALGRLGRPPLGRRVLRTGAVGWDVASLQFLLAKRGFAAGGVDGGYGPRTASGVTRFQTRAGLTADGVAGPATIAALRRAPTPRSPVSLARPVNAPLGDRYGMRGTRLHAGLDFPAPYGATVVAARSGRVVTVGYDGGWGRYVVVDHGLGVRTLYAHLGSITARSGAWVPGGRRIGLVGATGAASGPHLHFEVISRGANVDPLPALS